MELEQYLKTLFTLDGPPSFLRTFLDFHKYEIHGIIQTMAEELFYQGDTLLQSNEMYPVTPLQLHSLTMRLKMPIPTCDTGDKKKDIGHILDFLSQVHSLHICGSNKPIGSSNIIPNNLIFDLSPLKSLLLLKIDGCNPKMIQGLSNARKTVRKLQVQDSMKELKHLLLCDILHWDPECLPPMSVWSTILQADFSYNQLTKIDNSIWLLPNVETLDLSHNQISCIENLDHLSNLAHLQLSFNNFSVLPPLHVNLGNIISLNFAGNSVESLQAFSKLYSLMHLDVQSNQIQKISEISNLAVLPCLETLNLTGNPITMEVDYRTRVLEQFNNRAPEISLDNERPTQKELDTVAVLQAIRRAKEGSISQSRTSVGHSDGQVGHRHAASGAQSHSTDRRSKAGKKSAAAAPNNVLPSDIAEFKRQIEQIRAQGGTGWLRLWNQHQTENKNKSLNSVDSTFLNAVKHCDENSTPEVTNHYHSNHKEPAELLPLLNREFVLPEDLPDVSKKLFLDILESHCAHHDNTAAQAQVITPERLIVDGSLTSPETKKLQLPVIFWTVVIHWHKKMKFPACVALRDDCITILKFYDVGFENSFIKPHFVQHAQFHHESISSMEVGRHHHFVRLEVREKSVIISYVLKFSSRNLCASFVNTLQVNQKQATTFSFLYPNLDVLDVTEDDADLLKGAINYSWVAVDSLLETTENCLTCIAVTKCHVCLVVEMLGIAQDENGAAAPRKVSVLKKWNILTDVTDLSFESPIKADHDSENTSKAASTEPTGLTQTLEKVVCQSGFRIILWLADGTTLSIRYASAESRDEFLEAFVQERNSVLATNNS